MTNEEINAIALANGFTLKAIDDGGNAGLRPYVYDFARALIADQQEKMERLNFENQQLSDANLNLIANFGCYLIDNHESFFPNGENDIQQICVDFDKHISKEGK